MMTTRDDDYLICRHYYDHINDVSPEYKDFITFEHNDNHYFAWVNDGKVILRSEAYPDHERMVRGIKAIIKNRDIHERYSIDSSHGAHFLVLWGGGKDHKHTGNMGEHNEIGRSCPVKDKDDLIPLLLWKGEDFARNALGLAAVSKGATAATAAVAASSLAATAAKGGATASTTKKAGTTGGAAAVAADSSRDSGGGFNWWWLLPLLLIPLFFLWKGCGGDESSASVAPKVETPAKAEINMDLDAESKAAELKLAEEKAAAELAASEAAAKLEAEAAALAAEKAEADRVAAQKKAAKPTTSGSVNQTVNYQGNKSSGF